MAHACQQNELHLRQQPDPELAPDRPDLTSVLGSYLLAGTQLPCPQRDLSQDFDSGRLHTPEKIPLGNVRQILQFLLTQQFYGV